MIAFLGCLLLVFAQAAQQERNVVSAGELFKTASPSVVLIEIYGEDGKVSGSGSGFVVAADGVILTNYHLVAHTKRATVRLANGDAYDDVSVLDLDKRRDIALLKIKAVYLTPLKLGHSASLQVGDKLYALGNQFGVFQNTLSEGILSGVRQGDGYRMFQLSTPISRGSSGSPVFDTYGDVVGIFQAAVEDGQNINLAIPIDYAAGLLGSRTPRSLESIYEPPKPGESGWAAAGRPSDALKSDAVSYLMQKLNLWTKEDADKELGQPLARRDAFKGAAPGDVYEYNSPGALYSRFELTFPRPNGKLSDAYLYPQGFVSWKAMKGRMTNTQEMTKKKAENGAVLYGYQSNQHTVTILVDSLGNVVNVGVF